MMLSVIDSLFAMSAVGVPIAGESTSSPSQPEQANFEQTLGELVELAQNSFGQFAANVLPEFVDQTIANDVPHTVIDLFAPSDSIDTREPGNNESLDVRPERILPMPNRHFQTSSPH